VLLLVRYPRQVAQAAMVPVRVRERALEVALVTSSGGKRWILPKGSVADGESLVESARRETLEEAGLIGRVMRPALGRYAYERGKDQLVVAVFLMRVTEELDAWDEDDRRRRRWFALADAARKVEPEEVARLVRLAARRLRAVLD
jgi:phosphohistidine phosphatase